MNHKERETIVTPQTPNLSTKQLEGDLMRKKNRDKYTLKNISESESLG